jgi:hypothetical protein
MPKKKGLAKRYRFTQEELKVVPKGKSLAKRYRFSHEKIEGR